LALLVKPSLLTAAILLAQVLGAQPALAATQSGYQLWTDCAFVNFTCVSVQWEVFLGVTYSYVGGQIQIAPTEATVRSCLKNAQQIYWQFGYASSLFAQWYINNGSGDIDSDALNGSRNGFWPACSGSNDWMSLWTNGSYHWPPIGTRLRVPTSYCLDNGSGSAGCTTWRSTYTGWMN
ncbi:MAG: hypothetical protein HYX56_00705, partial [Chloroflexi bacterium]|nr:hypothetical protein [Chloroflexota bacterium]